MSVKAEATPQIEPDKRVPAWWPTFVGNFLAIALMLLMLTLPIILLLIVMLSAFVIHHFN